MRLAIFLHLCFLDFIFASYSSSIKLWTNPQVEIPLQYRIDSRIGFEARQSLANAISEIEKNTCIKYVNENDKNLNIYSVLEFREGFETTASNVRCDDEVSALWVTDNITRNEALRELMHSLGFFDENNRSDRDKYIKIMWDNLSPNKRKNLKKSK